MQQGFWRPWSNKIGRDHPWAMSELGSSLVQRERLPEHVHHAVYGCERKSPSSQPDTSDTIPGRGAHVRKRETSKNPVNSPDAQEMDPDGPTERVFEAMGKLHPLDRIVLVHRIGEWNLL